MGNQTGKMAKRTRLRLSDKQALQNIDDLMSLRGTTKIEMEGTLIVHNYEFDLTGAENNEVLTIQDGKIVAMPGGAGTNLGPAPDGAYGNDGGNLIGFTEGMSRDEAMDLIAEYIDSTAPKTPALLSEQTFAPENTFEAKEQNTNITRTNIVADFRPVVKVGGSNEGLFFRADQGDLTADIVDAVNVANNQSQVITLTTADDTGVYGVLTVLNEEIFNGLWKGLRAQVQSAINLTASNSLHSYTLTHSLTGTLTAQFYVDELLTPVFGATTIEPAVGAAVRYLSGVPVLDATAPIQANAAISNAVSNFYNATTVATLTTDASEVEGSEPLQNYVKGQVVNTVGLQAPVKALYHSEGVEVTLTAFNARGIEVTDIAEQTIATAIRVDTISDESIRVKSGSGLTPAIGVGAGEAGDVYNSSELLSVNEELQLVGGRFIYPTQNYTASVPAGPDYSTLTGTRYVTFKLDPIVNEHNFTFSIRESQNLTFSALSEIISNTGVTLQIKVEGASSTGWLDANKPKRPTGSPSVDNAGCLDLLNTPPADELGNVVRHVSFGTTPRSGNVYVRLGLPAASTITFKDIIKID